jgi:hypothetical protein
MRAVAQIRRAEALGYTYEGRLRGLIQPAKAGFVLVARPFTGWAAPCPPRPRISLNMTKIVIDAHSCAISIS